jgi:membrane-associated phospholipid phosphatase
VRFWLSPMKYGDELLDLQGRRISIARIISRLTPAPMINLYVGVIFSFYSPIGLGPFLTPISNIIIVIIMMMILPIAPILYSAKKGSVDLDVSEWESRTKYFLFSLPVYACVFIIYALLDCMIMSALAAAYFAVTSGVTIANLKSKVSVHGAGIGGPGTALFFVFGWLAFPVVMVWILVIWSRTVLRQHTLMQSIAGILLGVLITLCTYPFVYIV